MNDNSYPDLDDSELQILLQNVKHNKGYLDDPDCPYSEHVKNLLRSTVQEIEEIEDLEDLDLVHESSRLLKELKLQKDKLGEQDHTEAMAYYRTSTQLLEKLITYQERANSVKRISEFYATVMGVLEEKLEPEQITEVRNRLKDYA